MYKLYNGDCIEIMKTLDAETFQTCVTSPPYYGLRDYGVDGQIGLEQTPEMYVEKLVAVFREVRRVLKDDGTLWLNLGDSYAGSGRGPEGGLSKGTNFRELEGKHKAYVSDVIKPKDLIGIPWMVAFALRADGWYLRQDIIWAKPNPMPESVTDRCTKSHEYIFLLSKSQKYFYDYFAVMEPSVDPIGTKKRYNSPFMVGEKHESGKYSANGAKHTGGMKNLMTKGQVNHSMHKRRAEGLQDKDYPMRNKRDVWTVTTKPYSGAHFATFPTELIEPCILAGSKKGDTVLDPFNGSGTTGEVAIKNHRMYVGCELNKEYIELTKRRLSSVQQVLI